MSAYEFKIEKELLRSTAEERKQDLTDLLINNELDKTTMLSMWCNVSDIYNLNWGRGTEAQFDNPNWFELQRTSILMDIAMLQIERGDLEVDPVMAKTLRAIFLSQFFDEKYRIHEESILNEIDEQDLPVAISKIVWAAEVFIPPESKIDVYSVTQFFQANFEVSDFAEIVR